MSSELLTQICCMTLCLMLFDAGDSYDDAFSKLIKTNEKHLIVQGVINVSKQWFHKLLYSR